MEQSLFKISIVAVLIFFTHVGHAHMPRVLNKVFYSSWPRIEQSLKNNKIYSHYLALNTDENLKAYHLGLKALFSNHHLPSVEETLYSIRSHPAFCGILSKANGAKLSKKNRTSFLIFEELDSKNMSHFYVCRGNKLRHFTVNNLQSNRLKVASIDNVDCVRYPNLDSFLQCTLSHYL